MSNESHIHVATEGILGNGVLSLVDTAFAEGYVLHAGGRVYRGRGSVRRYVRLLRAAIPDERAVSVETLLEAGERTAWQRTLRGTHRAALLGRLPSGQPVEWRDQMASRFAGETIVEEWGVSGLAEALLLRRPRT